MDKEEAFISALFHNLGRTLAALYLPAEVAAIKAEDEGNQQAATLRILGMSYTSIGVAVARALNLPERLLQSMTRMQGQPGRQRVCARAARVEDRGAARSAQPDRQ